MRAGTTERTRRLLRRLSTRMAFAVMLAAGVAGTTGCSDILAVKLPGRIQASALDDPAIAVTLVLSVQGSFECFYSNYVAGGATFTDELYTSTEFFGFNQFNARQNVPSQSNTTGCVDGNAFGIYQTAGTAMFMADDATARLQKFTDAQVANRNVLIATAAAWGGYTATMLGEGYCSAVISSPDGTLGKEMTPAQTLAEAEKRFTVAIDLLKGGGSADILNMALVGRARVRLRLGNKAGALADALLVPPGYLKNATYSGANLNRENQVFTDHIRQQFLSVEPPFRNLTVGAVPDSRVKVTNSGKKGPDGFTDYWVAAKYPLNNSPIRLASWNEAQLIIAEAAGGQQAVDRINALRTLHGLPLYVPANVNDATEVRNQIIEERRREFFLEGHHLGDMINYKLTWPQGLNHKGNLTFAPQYCFHLPQQERDQNPGARGS